ncbi:MAG: hypothetical protein LC104_07820 [Bacteroidales bacterium]|nr:hypothetical protein [Bacteroidales bacterium]
MPATIVSIAEAVVDELNDADFSQELTAARHYLPRFELGDMTTPHVSVVPRSIASTGLDRNRDVFEYQIDVAVQKKIEPSLVNLDALMVLVEEMADYFRSQPLAGYPAARCTEVVNSPVYAPEHLEEFRQFTSVLTLTFKVWR